MSLTSRWVGSAPGLGKDPRFARHLLARDGAFARLDERPDPNFYAARRMVSHLDTTALSTVEALVEGLVTEESPVILDLMASWDSHLPESLRPARMVGLGLNEEELQANPVLTERIVHDLNADPALPFPDDTFDAVLNVVSVEYLTHPTEVFREVGRILKPGGLFLVVFSNRWFPPKVVRVWEDASERERVELVEELFRTSELFHQPGLFVSMGLPRPVTDRYYDSGVPSDPVFALFAETKGGSPGREVRRVPADPADSEIDHEAARLRRLHAGETMTCPYCGEPLSKWEVPDDPCIDWSDEFLSLCFNDACPFVVRGWRFMWEQGMEGHSYRFLLNPSTGGYTTVPIRGLHDLKPGIVAGG
jgi:SAM-dependent methyltransferase